MEGPPYYSETNLCVRVCDIDKPETCDRIKGVCQLAEPIGAGNGPGGIDYAVCVAPVCDEDRDCMGGMFGCEDQVCIPPSVTACAAKAAGRALHSGRPGRGAKRILLLHRNVFAVVHTGRKLIHRSRFVWKQSSLQCLRQIRV